MPLAVYVEVSRSPLPVSRSPLPVSRSPLPVSRSPIPVMPFAVYVELSIARVLFPVLFL